jgi:hypothetical protein
MKPQVVATVLAAASFFAIGASVERSTHQSATASIAAPSAPKVAPQRIADVVTLPEVTVRPSADDLALANGTPVAVEVEFIGPVVRVGAVAGHSANNRPRLAFDMPYYSFGKVLPQVSRE